MLDRIMALTAPNDSVAWQVRRAGGSFPSLPVRQLVSLVSRCVLGPTGAPLAR